MYLQRICGVTEKLLEHFGDRLEQVERMSEHTYRATLRGGELAHAVELSDGSLLLKETDSAWAGA